MSEAAASNTNIKVSLFILAVLALLAGWGYAIATFGYPAIIVPALTLTGLSLVSLVIVTQGR